MAERNVSLMVWPASGGEPICSAAIEFFVMGYGQRDTELAEGAPGLGPRQLLHGSMRHVLRPHGEFADLIHHSFQKTSAMLITKSL